MDPITSSIVTGLATGVFANFTTDAVKHFFTTVFSVKPELEGKLKLANSASEIESIFKEAIGVIDVAAGAGSITIDRGLLEAIRGIRFDHAHGTVNIAGTTISSKVVVTGGSSSATGKTVIGGNTVLKSQGTSIQLGEGCSIVMTGGATIKQS